MCGKTASGYMWSIRFDAGRTPRGTPTRRRIGILGRVLFFLFSPHRHRFCPPDRTVRVLRPW